GERPEHPAREVVGVSSQQLDEDLPERSRPRGFRVVEGTPGDAGQPEQHVAASETGMVVEVEDRLGQLTLVPTSGFLGGNQAGAQLREGRCVTPVPGDAHGGIISGSWEEIHRLPVNFLPTSRRDHRGPLSLTRRGPFSSTWPG